MEAEFIEVGLQVKECADTTMSLLDILTAFTLNPGPPPNPPGPHFF